MVSVDATVTQLSRKSPVIINRDTTLHIPLLLYHTGPDATVTFISAPVKTKTTTASCQYVSELLLLFYRQ